MSQSSPVLLALVIQIIVLPVSRAGTVTGQTPPLLGGGQWARSVSWSSATALLDCTGSLAPQHLILTEGSPDTASEEGSMETSSFWGLRDA